METYSGICPISVDAVKPSPKRNNTDTKSKEKIIAGAVLSLYIKAPTPEKNHINAWSVGKVSVRAVI